MQNRGRKASGDNELQPTPTHVARSPNKCDADPDLRQVGEAIGHCLIGDLHQSNHRRQHSQIPEPADQEVGILPPPNQNDHRDRGQQGEGSPNLPSLKVEDQERIPQRQTGWAKELAQVCRVRNQGIADSPVERKSLIRHHECVGPIALAGTDAAAIAISGSFSANSTGDRPTSPRPLVATGGEFKGPQLVCPCDPAANSPATEARAVA